MREHSKADDVLEPVCDRVVSFCVLSRALIKVRNVRKDDCVPLLLLEFFQLFNEPFKHVSRITKGSPTLKIGGVANIGIKRNHSRLVVQLLREIAVIEPGLLGLIAVDELRPFGHPLPESILESLPTDSDLVLRVGIVIAHCREDVVTSKTISDELRCVLHNIDIGCQVQAVEIVRNRVTAPENGIRLDLVRNVVKHVLDGPLWRVAQVVTPLSSDRLRRFGLATVGSAADGSAADVAHAGLVVPVHVEVADQRHFEEVLLIFGNHGLVLLINNIVSQGLCRLVLQQVLHPLIKINPLPLIRAADFKNKRAEIVLIKDVFLDHWQDRLCPLIGNNPRTSLALIPKEANKGVACPVADVD